MLDGEYYRQPTWERPICDGDFGLLPTPCVPNGGRKHNLARVTLRGRTLYREDGSKAQMDLETHMRLWASSIDELHGGKLNPNWVDWLMGWPIGWTGLEPLAMDRFQAWLRAHGSY